MGSPYIDMTPTQGPSINWDAEMAGRDRAIAEHERVTREAIASVTRVAPDPIVEAIEMLQGKVEALASSNTRLRRRVEALEARPTPARS
jgi:hypothetical protein